MLSFHECEFGFGHYTLGWVGFKHLGKLLYLDQMPSKAGWPASNFILKMHFFFKEIAAFLAGQGKVVGFLNPLIICYQC